jgi:hypothetical protein
VKKERRVKWREKCEPDLCYALMKRDKTHKILRPVPFGYVVNNKLTKTFSRFKSEGIE